MTAEQYLEEQEIENNSIYNYEGEDVGYISNAMIKFAKLHCEEQARIISENACLTLESEISINGACCSITAEIDKDSILNAYDLNNIK